MRGIKDNIYIVGDVANKSRSGFPVLGILLLILVTLKVLGKITLPWVWVLTPLWILPVTILVALVIILVISIIAVLVAFALGR